ncbi:MAG TPA: ABC transporter permease [archaeon]|nr:ABC transporter permease [archaeon]
MNTIKYIVWKEFKQIIRDPMMLRVMFAIPLVQLFILGYTITLDVKNVGLVIRDADRSDFSRLLVEKVVQSRRFRIVGYEESQPELKDYFRRGAASLAFSIPEGFEKDIITGRSPELQILVDGVDSNSSMVAMGYLQGILRLSLANLRPTVIRTINIPSAQPLRITPQIRVWFNPNLESSFYMLPGIVAILVTMTTTLLTGLGIVREREIGTLEQLSVTPIHPYQLILGKTIPFAALSFLMLTIALSVVAFWFRIPMEGSLLLLLTFAFIFLFSTLGVGLFVSTLVSNQLQAVFIIFFFNLFCILTSGLFAPIHNMPPFVQKLTYLNPVRYFMEIIRGIYLKGSGLEYLWKEGLALLCWGIGATSFSVFRFKKQVD